MSKIPMTAVGFNRLQEELKRLKTIDRPAIIRAIAEAREHGDISENAEYHAARERQSFIEGRVMELEDKIARAEVIDVSKLSGKTVKFGATVTLADEETDEKTVYQIVGEDEADISKGRLSVTSPWPAPSSARASATASRSRPRAAPASYEIVKVRSADRGARPASLAPSTSIGTPGSYFEVRMASAERTCAHIGRRRQLGGEEALIAVPVGRDDLQQEIGLAGQHVRLAHLGPAGDQRSRRP